MDRPGARNAVTDVAGITVGHWHRLDPDAALGSGWAAGCTVVRARGGATAAVDVRGGGPGTRETDLLAPEQTVQVAHAVLLSGGSAFGLAAADGVMRLLEQQGEGLAIAGPGQVVPIVPGAVVFDLPVGDWAKRPDADSGYRAAAGASAEVPQGTVGAGVGARAGALKGGVGTASVVLGGGPAAGATVGAVVVANPVGSVYDPGTGVLWAAAAELGGEFGLRGVPTPVAVAAARGLAAKQTALNTTIGVVATDAPLSKAACRRLATAGHDGLARAVRPAHSPLDGDTLFALATGAFVLPERQPAPAGLRPDAAALDALCAAAANVVERAIAHAVLAAAPVAGIPTYRQVFGV